MSRTSQPAHPETRRRGRWSAGAIAAGLLVGSSIFAGATSAQGTAPPSAARCNNRVNNTANKLLECVNVAGVRQHQSVLQFIANANDGTRASGTPGFDDSADYAARIFSNAGYEVTRQTFDFEYSEDLASLVQVSPTPTDYGTDVNAPSFDPIVDTEPGTGVVVPVDLVIPPTPAPSSTSGCEAEDFAGFPAGGVALVQRGTCAFVAKALNAKAAGAVGVVIFNEGQPGRDGPFGGIGDSTGIDIPVVFVPFSIGESLYQDTLLGPVTVTVDDSQVVETRPTENIIAESRSGNDGEVVMVGAHLDSVIEGPGINDNGSGSAAILEVAENMRRVNPRNTVRFALWGAEESGLLGSQYYVDNLDDQQRQDIALYLNFDMIGSPNYFQGVYDGDGSGFGVPGPPGSEAIEAQFEDFYAARGLASQPTEFSGRSDYGPFIAVGIPSGGLFTGAEGIKTEEEAALYGGTAGEAYDSCYHQACDNFDNVSLEALDVNADAVALATLTYSKSTRSLGVGDGNRVAARVAAFQVEHVNHNRDYELIAS
jgi:Zn-dependent M28 family amino/carboxypeptidase